MNFLKLIENNGLEVLLALTIANISAQLLKVLFSSLKHRSPQYKMAVSTGGMPSSHSATIVAMAVSVGLIDGFKSTSFALSLCVAFIVMYDAAGIRRSASNQAMVLNELRHVLTDYIPNLKVDKLKELLGHSPTEVFAGALWGIIVSAVLHYSIAYLV